MAGYVEFYNVGKTYETRRGPAVIVEEFNLNMDEGEFVALLGHSGCGKSTVLSMVAGLSSISMGGIVVARREVTGPGPDRGVVFQSPCLMPWLTAGQNVGLGVDRVFGRESKALREKITRYYLRLVGLGDAINKRASELSRGMQQRVAIARAFAISPKMLLLDEPFGMLDSLTRMELQEILLEILEKDRKTVMMVTHDIDEALFCADRVVMMTNGPRARVGKVLTIPFSRPRNRLDVIDHPEYYRIRGEMIEFLEEQEALKHNKQSAA